MSVRWDQMNHLTRAIFRKKIEREDLPKPCVKFVVYQLGRDMCAFCKRARSEHHASDAKRPARHHAQQQ